MDSKSIYIGDGVYVEFDGYYIVVRVNSHTNDPVVFLEPEVMEALISYYEKLKTQALNPA